MQMGPQPIQPDKWTKKTNRNYWWEYIGNFATCERSSTRLIYSSQVSWCHEIHMFYWYGSENIRCIFNFEYVSVPECAAISNSVALWYLPWKYSVVRSTDSKTLYCSFLLPEPRMSIASRTFCSFFLLLASIRLILMWSAAIMMNTTSIGRAPRMVSARLKERIRKQLQDCMFQGERERLI